MINRSTTRETPHFPVTPYEVAILFGTLAAETILASVHVRAHQQAGHMDASDLIKALQTPCEEGVVHIWKITGVDGRIQAYTACAGSGVASIFSRKVENRSDTTIEKKSRTFLP